MASSATDICNLALGHLGEGRINSLDEDNVAARACNLHYDPTRDAVLRSHRWNFAQARVTLSRLAEAPAFGWSYQYELPADCLRVLEVNDSEAGDVISDEFIVEGRKILTNADTVRLVYTRAIRDVAAFDSLFVEALGIKLAIVLSETIRGTTNKTEELIARYERTTAPLARRVDANEGRRRKGLLTLNSFALRERGAGESGSLGGGSGSHGATGSTFDAANPGAIGGTTPAAGAFTTLTASTVTATAFAGSGAGLTGVVLTTGSYANPAWITSLPYSKISGAPSWQPLDADLTAIAALNTKPFGRSLLTTLDAAAGQTTLGLSHLVEYPPVADDAEKFMRSDVRPGTHLRILDDGRIETFILADLAENHGIYLTTQFVDGVESAFAPDEIVDGKISFINPTTLDSVRWSSIDGQWVITDFEHGEIWASPEDVATPDLVTVWTQVGGVGSYPSTPTLFFGLAANPRGWSIWRSNGTMASQDSTAYLTSADAATALALKADIDSAAFTGDTSFASGNANIDSSGVGAFSGVSVSSGGITTDGSNPSLSGFGYIAATTFGGSYVSVYGDFLCYNTSTFSGLANFADLSASGTIGCQTLNVSASMNLGVDGTSFYYEGYFTTLYMDAATSLLLRGKSIAVPPKTFDVQYDSATGFYAVSASTSGSLNTLVLTDVPLDAVVDKVGNPIIGNRVMIEVNLYFVAHATATRRATLVIGGVTVYDTGTVNTSTNTAMRVLMEVRVLKADTGAYPFDTSTLQVVVSTISDNASFPKCKMTSVDVDMSSSFSFGVYGTAAGTGASAGDTKLISYNVTALNEGA